MRRGRSRSRPRCLEHLRPQVQSTTQPYEGNVRIRRAAIASCALVLALGVTRADADTSKDIFLVKSTSKAPEAIVAAIKSYAERMKWQYLGDSAIKQGEVRLVKICMPEVGKLLWSAGLEISALLPCGNV